MLEESPVPFIRPAGMLPQVVPQRGGLVSELQPLVNIPNNEDFALYVGFLLGFFQPYGACPHLGLFGEEGSAKSNTTRKARDICDPNEAPSRREPREPNDILVAAKNNLMLCYDNLSRLPNWVSDMFCCLATGSGDGRRKLYADDEEVIFSFKRQVVFNAINEIASNSDLLSRTILLELPVLDKNKRRKESDIDGDFAKSQPFILGALFDAVAIGLSRFKNVNISDLPRMADFVSWVEACSPGLGWDENYFVGIYSKNREAVSDSAAELSTVARLIIKLWLEEDEAPFAGSASELYERLNRAAKPNYSLPNEAKVDIREAKDWPKDSPSLERVRHSRSD
ncbi:MAG: hypothetical protein EOP04_15145 [Proteobacteria bacterium]|nr:MAG: hypothetical protein EOP04_15145 [Pseudomonadota bacterium]